MLDAVPDGLSILYEFNRVGIQLVGARDDLPEGEYGWPHLGLKSHEAHADIVGLIRWLTGGLTHSILLGRNTHTSLTPYGIDRLVSSPEGRPLYRLRDQPDGTQEMRTVDGSEALRVYPPIEHKRKTTHHKKHPSELITFVPGDPVLVRIAQRIFERKYVDRWGPLRIAKELNDQDIMNSNGQPWGPGSVIKLLGNTVYTDWESATD